MTIPLLYSFRRCPYAMRARLGLLASQAQVRLREIELKNKPQAMLDASPKGTVPVMIVTEGMDQRVIDESLDIMLWALSNQDPHKILGEDGEHTQSTLALIEQNDQKFKYWLDRYKYADRYPEHSQTYYRGQACEFLSELEQLLEQNQYLQGSQPSLADIAIFPFIRQFAFVDKPQFDGLPYPKLQRWLELWLNHPWFEKTMEKYQPWLQQEQEYLLGE
ncbi:glutathione S-transferase [Parashewanella tropica]|uniref:glutathione S-transferase n=1 Tax=Parashewanella tropica TaxID=2547970 RepID=UPI00105A279F|nr:glutathione S-transferase [Parashewanella tropica]